MSYKGMMDGWHGDENECNGHCGVCDECEHVTEQKGESEYESEREEQ